MIYHLNLPLERLSCSGGFCVAHWPSEAHMKTEEGHSSPAPGYLCNIDRVINKNTIKHNTNNAHLSDQKITHRNKYESD